MDALQPIRGAVVWSIQGLASRRADLIGPSDDDLPNSNNRMYGEICSRNGNICKRHVDVLKSLARNNLIPAKQL